MLVSFKAIGRNIRAARSPSPVDAFAAQTKPLPTHGIGRGFAYSGNSTIAH